MRDAIGGSVTIVIISVFIVIVLAYLAFNVNYTKAFRMKDKIITVYEEYNGNCQSACQNKIVSYAHDIGYNVSSDALRCREGWSKYQNYFCYKEVTVSNIKDVGRKKYYKIATKINIEIPIIQNVFNFQMFWITGDTKTFTEK